jgi:hypothetical protein
LKPVAGYGEIANGVSFLGSSADDFTIADAGFTRASQI